MSRRTSKLGVDEMLKVVGAVYDAALDPGQWDCALDAMAIPLRSHIYGFILRGKKTGRPLAIPAGRGMGGSIWDRYLAHYGAIDPLAPRGILRGSGEVFASDDLMDQGLLARTEFFNDFMLANDMLRWIGSRIDFTGDVIAPIAFQRPNKGGRPFDERDRRFLRALMPHMERALQMQLRLGRVASERTMLTSALERLSLGVVFLDADGHVMEANRAARRLACRGDGLTFGRRGVHTENPAETATLQRLIGEAATTSAGAGLKAGGHVAVSRTSGLRPLQLTVMPLSQTGFRSWWCSSDVPAVILFVGDPEREPTPAQALCQLYGLTPAESRLAELLGRGVRLADAAARLEVSIETVRTHLKRVFDKTGKHSQTELARLLATSLSAVGEET